MTDRILPAFLVLLKIRKSLGNVIVNLAQRRTLVRRVLINEKRMKNRGMSLSIK